MVVPVYDHFRPHSLGELVDLLVAMVTLIICTLNFLMSFVDRLAWANLSLSVSESMGLPLSILGAYQSWPGAALI